MKEKFRTFIIIYAVLLSGIVMAAIFTEAFDWETIFHISEEQLPWLFIPVGAITLSEFLFRKTMKQIDRKKTDENTRLGIYQTASIIRWAILEGAALVCILLPGIPAINILLIIAFYLLVCPRFWKFQQIVAPL